MSEVIATVEEAVLAIRPRLFDYLGKKLGLSNPKKPFRCPFHDDAGRPNMVLNPKDDLSTAHCFSCGVTADIFRFASKLEELPASGAEWVTMTLPVLAKTLDIKLQLGEVSEASRAKSSFYKLCQDITDILKHKEDKYGEERGWKDTRLVMGSIDTEELLDKLTTLGWDKDSVLESSIVQWKKRNIGGTLKEQRLFGIDKFTFVIQDSFKRPVGFIARWKEYNREKHEEKYFHGPNNLIFNKSKILFGLSVDLKECRNSGVYLVEGPGDVAALHTKGIFNCAAVLGTSITEDHLLELKKLGIKKAILSLDWDEAGRTATDRIIDNVIPKVIDIVYVIKSKPKTGEKDVDEYLSKHTKEEFIGINEITIFEWKLSQIQDTSNPELVCQQMLPMIATEQSAIKRSLLMRHLSEFTSIDYAAIEADVESMRNLDLKQKRTSIEAAGQEFLASLQKDPENAFTLMSSFEQELEKIERRYNKSSLGVNYQLQRYDEIQTLRKLSDEDHNAAMFQFGYFKEFAKNLSGGMPLTRGCLIYAGGRANSGKTLSCLALGSDIALYDNDAMTIVHSIDDSYEQIEPRLKTNLYNLYYSGDLHLSLDMVVSPWKFKDDAVKDAIRKADNLFKELLAEEKLIILDSNDGANLTTLERHLRYYRTRYPNRKLLTICDNTHDYQDFAELDQTTRMKMISAQQKRLASKYGLCMLATAEYRKAPPGSSTKMILPTNDDIADSRAMSYKPNIIFHVYNDLADRQENAEIYYINKDGKKCPRLLWVFTKNKINSFKGRLVNDVDPSAVMIFPKNLEEAEAEWLENKELPEEDRVAMNEFDNKMGYEQETDYKDE